MDNNYINDNNDKEESKTEEACAVETESPDEAEVTAYEEFFEDEETGYGDSGPSDEVSEEETFTAKKGRFFGKKYLLFCFFIPFTVMAMIYIAMKVWPLSGNSVLVLDLNAQYVYYLEKFRLILEIHLITHTFFLNGKKITLMKNC